jgi:hypothetical protein
VGPWLLCRDSPERPNKHQAVRELNGMRCLPYLLAALPVQWDPASQVSPSCLQGWSWPPLLLLCFGGWCSEWD